MIDVIIAEAFAAQVSAEPLSQAAATTLRQQGVLDEIEMTILVDDDERIQELNRQFRDIDRPTDVLSFPADEFDPDSGLRYLGDIIVSFPTAQRQAAQARVAASDEIQLLVIHGTLHLLGHDHAAVEEKRRMWQAQAEILDQLGIAIDQLPE